MSEFRPPPLPFSAPDNDIPVFAEPVPLDLDDEERKDIADTIGTLYRQTVQAREKWSKQHQDYDLMFRGELDSGRAGPWPDSANLHVQMPYWLVDSYNTRLVSAVYGQIPLVNALAEEDGDAETASHASSLVSWHLQPKRMNARQAWSRISKTRCIHGRGVGMVPWVKDEYVYRVTSELEYERTENGEIRVDDDGMPLRKDNPVGAYQRETKMNGPLLLPIEWDDLIEPLEGINLQPVCPSNPLGADWVGIRQWEPLSLIWNKKDKSYPYIDDHETYKDKEKWLDGSPSQDRSGTGAGTENQARVRMQDALAGKDRNQSNRSRSPRARPNPEFETIVWMMPWAIENEVGELEEAECVFFFCVKPELVLGAFRLSDLQWKNRRPLIELDFQTVGTRRDSMGIMQIVQHLSAELDTIHNMRIDVGFATNMPFFFYRATSAINPERIVLRPGKGVPVDDVRDVSFPQLQNVTSFYYQEEQLLYSLVERVLGVTDLFLGVSPTRGAAARHATGFVGTQQEALARTEELITQDAAAFSQLCHLIYELEVQFGPEERLLRLQGKEGPLTQPLSRDQLWFRGEYDFRLGANHGLYSSMMKQQQAQALMQFAPNSPLIMQDPGRYWEFANFVLQSLGLPDPQLFLGPKEASSSGAQKDPDEENGDMDQFLYGVDQPAPTHMNDNDQKHLQVHMDHINSNRYEALGRPNFAGHMQHIQATHMQMQQKQQMQQMAAMQPQSQPGAPGQPGEGGAQPNARNVAALQGVEQQGGMGDVNASPGVNGNGAPDMGAA